MLGQAMVGGFLGKNGRYSKRAQLPTYSRHTAHTIMLNCWTFFLLSQRTTVYSTQLSTRARSLLRPIACYNMMEPQAPSLKLFERPPSVTLVIVLVTIAVYYISRRRRTQLPPGPQGWPIIGNALVLTDSPWLKFTEWMYKYGE